MSTRSEIEETAKRYMHRDDFLTADFDFAFAVAAREFGQHLRAQVNQVQADLQLVDGAVDLGERAREVSTVMAEDTGGWRPLQSASDTYVSMARSNGASGPPVFYSVVGSWLRVGPRSDGLVRVTYWEEPELLSAGSDSNAVSAAYPELYLYRVLQELAMVTQDFELAAMYAGKVQDRLDGLNLQGRMIWTGNAPAMTAA